MRWHTSSEPLGSALHALADRAWRANAWPMTCELHRTICVLGVHLCPHLRFALPYRWPRCRLSEAFHAHRPHARASMTSCAASRRCSRYIGAARAEMAAAVSSAPSSPPAMIGCPSAQGRHHRAACIVDRIEQTHTDGPVLWSRRQRANCHDHTGMKGTENADHHGPCHRVVQQRGTGHADDQRRCAEQEDLRSPRTGRRGPSQ